MGVLSDEMKRVIARQRLGFVATVCPDGTPNLSPKGTLSVLDDDHLVFADLRSPGTVANLRVNPSVEVNVVDHFVRKGYRLKGKARVIDGGEELERLVGFFSRGQLSDAPRRIRTVVVIRVDEARPLISPGYDSETDESSMRERWTRYYLGDGEDAV
jgi:predicted pyridoxine 5'-phosphate oxidase superfamily flavin-nucleotide-binding protein